MSTTGAIRARSKLTEAADIRVWRRQRMRVANYAPNLHPTAHGREAFVLSCRKLAWLTGGSRWLMSCADASPK